MTHYQKRLDGHCIKTKDELTQNLSDAIKRMNDISIRCTVKANLVSSIHPIETFDVMGSTSLAMVYSQRHMLTQMKMNCVNYIRDLVNHICEVRLQSEMDSTADRVDFMVAKKTIEILMIFICNEEDPKKSHQQRLSKKSKFCCNFGCARKVFLPVEDDSEGMRFTRCSICHSAMCLSCKLQSVVYGRFVDRQSMQTKTFASYYNATQNAFCPDCCVKNTSCKRRKLAPKENK